MRKILILFILIISLVTAFIIPASAAVLDPYEYGDVIVDGDLELVKIKLPTDNMRISLFEDGVRFGNVQGPIAQFPWSMAKVDNLDIYCLPFGYESFGSGTNPANYTYVDNVFPLSGIPSGSSLDGVSQLLVGVVDATQTCDIYVSHNMILYDKSMNQVKSIELYNHHIIDWNGTNAAFHTSWSVPTDDLIGCSFFSVVSHIELNGVDVESDNSVVYMDCRVNLINLVIPYSQLYQLQQQGEKTNQLLQQIGNAMKDNGQKLDDVIAGNQQIHDDINNAVNGTIPPAAVPDGQDKIDDLDNQEGQLRDDAADGLQQGLDMMDDTLDALFTYSFGFFALGLIFELFFQIPFFNVLVSLSLVLGILASFLGIIVSISSAGGGRYSKTKSHHQRSPKSNQPKPGGKA